MGGITVHPYTPATPYTPPNTPFLHNYTYSTIFGKYQYIISLTFSLGPEEAAIV